MINVNDIFNYLSDNFPYKKRSAADWIVPASIGLCLGVACGVGVGLLIAPSSGEHTRRRLRDSAERLKDRAMTATQKVKGQLTHGVNEIASERSFANDVGGMR